MTNELDERTGPANDNGREINVIDKQIPVTVGVGSLLFEISLWTVSFLPGILALYFNLLPDIWENYALLGAGILPGLIFIFVKINALNSLRRLQQKIQADASQIDNYLEQRVVILSNVASLLEKSITLDKEVMQSVAAYRSGIRPENDVARNQLSSQIDTAFSTIHFAMEAYPDLKSQTVIVEAMRQNAYLQQEITAARSLYNDAVLLWNQNIFDWPAKQIVAARAHYTTRVPFIASSEVKQAARRNFF